MPHDGSDESEPIDGLAVKVFGPPPAAKDGDDDGDEPHGMEAFDDYAEQAFPSMTPKQRAALHKAIMACMAE